MEDTASPWSYYTLVAKNTDVYKLDERFNALGAEGWELATSLTTVKTWVNLTGNDLVLVFRKRGDRVRPSAEALAIANGYDPNAPAY